MVVRTLEKLPLRARSLPTSLIMYSSPFLPDEDAGGDAGTLELEIRSERGCRLQMSASQRVKSEEKQRTLSWMNVTEKTMQGSTSSHSSFFFFVFFLLLLCNWTCVQIKPESVFCFSWPVWVSLPPPMRPLQSCTVIYSKNSCLPSPWCCALSGSFSMLCGKAGLFNSAVTSHEDTLENISAAGLIFGRDEGLAF